MTPQTAAPGSSWGDVRRSGARAFGELGLPTSKHESWRHSNPAALASLPLPVAPRPEDLHIAGLHLPDAGARVFLVDGHYFAEPDSAPAGATVVALATAHENPAVHSMLAELTPDSPLTALNSAMLDDGLFVDVHAQLEQPLHIVHISLAHPERVATHPRVLLRLAANARASVVEWFAGDAPDALCNAVTQVHLEDGAALDHVRVHAAASTHVGASRVIVGRDAHYRLHTATAGTQLAREEIDVSLCGAGAHASLGGLLLGRGDDLVDHQVRIEHAAPATKSEQLFKTIVDDRATGTFSGTVVVRADAAGTDAEQTSRALLLSERARANAKPQLEIYTDDVRCTHGSTTGQLEEDALFYLRSRGLDRASAQRMLLEGFTGEWLSGIRDAGLRESVGSWVGAWLARGETP